MIKIFEACLFIIYDFYFILIREIQLYIICNNHHPHQSPVILTEISGVEISSIEYNKVNDGEAKFNSVTYL